MTLKRQVKRGVEQRMTGTDEGGERLSLWCDQRLLKGDALVARQHWFASSDLAVAVAYRRGDMSHFITAGLSLGSCGAQLLSAWKGRKCGVGGLMPPRVAPRHNLPTH